MFVVAPRDWNIPTNSDEGTFPSVTLSPISSPPFIMAPQHLKHAHLINTMAATEHVKLNEAFHSYSNEMTIEVIKRGMGISIAPNTFVLSQPQDMISLYGIQGFPSWNPLYYNYRVDHHPSADETAFLALLKEWMQQQPLLASTVTP